MCICAIDIVSNFCKGAAQHPSLDYLKSLLCWTCFAKLISRFYNRFKICFERAQIHYVLTDLLGPFYVFSWCTKSYTHIHNLSRFLQIQKRVPVLQPLGLSGNFRSNLCIKGLSTSYITMGQIIYYFMPTCFPILEGEYFLVPTNMFLWYSTPLSTLTSWSWAGILLIYFFKY